MTIQPHGAFGVLTPDAVAETWDGVYGNEMVPDLYEQLWALVEKYDNSHRNNIEDLGPHDVIGINTVKGFWDDLPEPTKLELNRLAVLNERH